MESIIALFDISGKRYRRDISDIQRIIDQFYGNPNQDARNIASDFRTAIAKTK